MSDPGPTEAAQRFVEKWSASELSERAASHEHFIDLCRLIGQPAPAEADPTGTDYCFEKAVKVTQAASKGSKGEKGFVDVWKRGFFAWEYKRKDKYKSLDEAYRQLYQYRDALDNPPLSGSATFAPPKSAAIFLAIRPRKPSSASKKSAVASK